MTRQFRRLARFDSKAAEQIGGSTDIVVASELTHRTTRALIGGFLGAGTEDDLITRSNIVAAIATNDTDGITEL